MAAGFLKSVFSTIPDLQTILIQCLKLGLEIFSLWLSIVRDVIVETASPGITCWKKGNPIKTSIHLTDSVTLRILQSKGEKQNDDFAKY